MKFSKFSRWALAFILFLMPFSAHSDAFFYITNETGYYLHVVVEDEHYPFLAPGGVLEIHDKEEIRIKVYYSPGQEVTGEATRTLASDYDDYNCGGCDCDEKDNCGEVIYDNSWTVYASDLN